MKKDAHKLTILPWTTSRYLIHSTYSCSFDTAQAIKGNLNFSLLGKKKQRYNKQFLHAKKYRINDWPV